jgi:adenosylcobyric acid synthase
MRIRAIVAHMRGSLLVAGTASDAGKSVLTAGICRWLARQGVRVAPFKAQNMSNNSMVTPDGAEIGRAQAMQAAAAGVPAEAAMNPVLLKPGSDMSSHLVVLGRPAGEASAVGYWGSDAGRARLLGTVLDAFDDLRSRFDVVVCEGAGSPAEINLRRHDIVNMGLARARGLPVIVVGDIDRGGVFAALYGTLALLDAADQAHIRGFVVNKFRGEGELLVPGLLRIAALTGRPVLGVLPYLKGIWIDAEDAVVVERASGAVPGSAPGGQTLRVAVIRLPRIANFTDVDALALEPGVAVRYADSPDEVAEADLAVLPGTRATVADLGWLRDRGLDVALARRAAAGRPVLGICGGYQMLGARIRDGVESTTQVVEGLRLLPVTTTFAAAKVLGRPSGFAGATPVTGYEIHHGAVRVDGGRPWFTSQPDRGQGGGEPLDGCRAGSVSGTLWHGVFENDAFRRQYLSEVARCAGRAFVPVPGTSFEAARQAQFDMLADAVEQHLDTGALARLIEHGPTTAMPVLRAGL